MRAEINGPGIRDDPNLVQDNLVEYIVPKTRIPNGVVGGAGPGHETFSLFDRTTSQVATRLLSSNICTVEPV